MEATEETVLVPHIAKGRRTKRRRLQQPAVAAATSSSCSDEISGEEEDMANCLMLLARGRTASPARNSDDKGAGTVAAEKVATSRGVATNGKAAAGFYVYECKTCSKCFPSFQALGGHRTSHKKSKSPVPPALQAEETKPGSTGAYSVQLDTNSSPNSISGKTARVHECSICGSEFSSGQALGGHMRRHRPAIPPEPVEAKKERKGTALALDLNLPAPADDCSCSHGGFLSPPSAAAAAATSSGTPGFSFASKPLLMPRSALVDCHY